MADNDGMAPDTPTPSEPTTLIAQSKQLKVDYQARFGNYEIQVSKLANKSGMGRVFLWHLQRSLDSDKPMDFREFADKLLNPSALRKMAQEFDSVERVPPATVSGGDFFGPYLADAQIRLT